MRQTNNLSSSTKAPIEALTISRLECRGWRSLGKGSWFLSWAITRQRSCHPFAQMQVPMPVVSPLLKPMCQLHHCTRTNKLTKRCFVNINYSLFLFVLFNRFVILASKYVLLNPDTQNRLALISNLASSTSLI